MYRQHDRVKRLHSTLVTGHNQPMLKQANTLSFISLDCKAIWWTGQQRKVIRLS